LGRSLSEEASDEETGYISGDEEYSASPSAELKPAIHYPARASHRAAINKTYREDSDESEMNSSDAENDFKSDAPAAALVTLASAEATPVRQPSASTAPSEPPPPRPTLHPPRAPSQSMSVAAELPQNEERARSEIALARVSKPPLTYTSTTYHEGGAKLTHFHSTPVQSFWQEAPRPPATFLEMRYGAQ
jgi:cell wall-associated NlpC family hydrolase